MCDDDDDAKSLILAIWTSRKVYFLLSLMGLSMYKPTVQFLKGPSNWVWGFTELLKAIF